MTYKKKKKERKFITIYLGESLFNQLEDYLEDNADLDRSKLVRHLLTTFLLNQSNINLKP